MKRHSVLTLGLVTACLGIGGAGCGDDAKPAAKKKPAATAGAGAGGRAPGTGGAPATGGVPATGGATAGSATTTGGAGASAGAGTAGEPTAGGGGYPMAGSGGSGGACDIAALQTFARSDTAETWDDNDFSDVILNSGCPTVADVTWPHEESWENADPSEANHESVHFTLDSYYTGDLTGKQLNLTIELTGDEQGPDGARGGYIVSLVSVSTWEKIIVVGGAGSAGTDGGMSGAGGVAAGAGGVSAGYGGQSGGGYAGATGTAGAAGTLPGAAGASGSGGMSAGAEAGGYGGQTTTTEQHYSEAVSPDLENRTLYRVGDRANLTFQLPSKTAAEDSYDPTTVIKINVRIHTVFFAPEDETGGAGAGGEGGGDATPPDVPSYDYVSSQFSITNFTVTDAMP